MPMRTYKRAATRGAVQLRPILYLDIDDTLLTYSGNAPRAARGAHDFLVWALDRFEVRWLTTWCPSGQMGADLARDFCKMLEVDPEQIAELRGHDWTFSKTKLDGIGWLEHLVLDRPFLWIEDDYGVGDRERVFLEELGLAASLRCCNVTRDADALVRLHERLMEEYPEEYSDEEYSDEYPGAYPEGNSAD